MGDGQHCLVGKAFTDGLLEQLVCLLVHTCCGLVNAQDLDGVQKGGETRGETVTCPETSLQPTSSFHTSWPLGGGGLFLPSYFSICKKSPCQTQQLSLS